MSPARKHLDLVCDSRARGIDEVEKRDANARGGLLDAQDLLDCPRAPAAGLDRRVVGHHRDLTVLDHAKPGDDAVGRQLVREHVGKQAILDERACVEQQVEPLARGQLLLLAQLGQIPRAPLDRLLAKLAMPGGH